MIILVTGDRNWSDRDFLFARLDEYHAISPITRVVEGCARGADMLSGDHPPIPPAFADDPGFPGGWAWARGIPGDHYPADWVQYRRAAGPIRNRQQLREGHPDVVLAFHDDLARSKGTADMVAIARKAGVPVVVFGHEKEEA